MPKKKQQNDVVPVALVREGQESLMTALEKDPEFSLEPDPTGALGLTEQQKKFLISYGEFRSIPLASQLVGITEEEGRDFFFDPICKAERERINRVRNYRKFSRRLLTIDEVGGYLTSLLIDEDVGAGDQLSSKDKLQITKQIIDLNKLKAEAFSNPATVIDADYEDVGVKDLTPEELKDLIEKTKEEKHDNSARKNELIAQINKDKLLDGSELDYFYTCSVKELEKLLKEQNDLEEKLEDGND